MLKRHPLCYLPSGFITGVLPSSCNHLIFLDNLLPHDNYWLTIGSPDDGVPLGNTIIYCHDMASSSPKAFLPLPAGRKTNYASIGKEFSSDRNKCYSNVIFSDHYYIAFDMVRITWGNSTQVCITRRLGEANFLSRMD